MTVYPNEWSPVSEFKDCICFLISFLLESGDYKVVFVFVLNFLLCFSSSSYGKMGIVSKFLLISLIFSIVID